MDSSTIDYFPSKLAKGSRFCNRVEERKTLKRNIDLGRHTVLVSPRRYGKSSLVHKTVSEMSIPFASIDLFLAHGDRAVTKRILEGVSSVISQIIPISEKALSLVQKYFANFKVILDAAGFGLQMSHETSIIDPVEQIFDSLKSLALLAKEKRKKVLIFIDEFQDIASAESSKSIQGAIRHVAQDTSNCVFIFSGSSRNLLLELFDDKTKPLYMLCDKILLDRMSSADYAIYIQEAARDKWGSEIDETILTKILSIVELHSFYVNMLCNELWKKDKSIVINDINAAWEVCYETEERRLVAELEKLTNNQQDILKYLAINPTMEPMGQKFLTLVGMPISSVRIGIKNLLEKDMIFIVKKEDSQLPLIKKGQYRVLDPLLAYALRKYS